MACGTAGKSGNGKEGGHGKSPKKGTTSKRRPGAGGRHLFLFPRHSPNRVGKKREKAQKKKKSGCVTTKR